MSDLENIIADSISDAELPLEEPTLEAEAPADDLQHVEEPTTTDSTPEPQEATPASETEVQSPATKPVEAKADDFEKRFGIPQNSPTGRENRIPYSRVKRITEKAEKDTDTRVRAEFAPKLTEFEIKVKDYETKLTDYEGRLNQVAQFEQILQNDPPQLLTMLYKIPQYQTYLKPLFEAAQAPTPQEATPQQEQIPSDMPQPDQTLPDGTMVYSMEGLSKLNTWNRKQAANEARETTLAEVNQKFGPIYQQWEQYQRVQNVLPKVQKQITEARQWPMFTENEADIVKALQADQNLSLEGAYRQVIFPRLQESLNTAQVNKDQLVKDTRASVFEELKKTPRSTSATSGGTKPGNTFVASPDGGDDKISAIIRASIREKQ